jgi:two-component system, NtrC family, sensor kinase
VRLFGIFLIRISDFVLRISDFLPIEVAMPERSPSTPPAPGEAGRVLVADDKAPNREMLCHYVAQLGHQATPAENGRTALALLRSRPFDLVLLDVLMPEMDGYAALGHIKADARLREIPVLMISGLDEVDSVVRCIEQGAEDYLYKPFDPVLLRARINACLEKKRLRDAERRRAEELERALRQLKAAQDQLVVQEKMASLGTLTAGIAHELRNPLNFITNFALLASDQAAGLRDLLASAQVSPETAAEMRELLEGLGQCTAKIHEHGTRANHIIGGMLLHARGQSGERVPTDLNALLAEYVNLAYHGLRSRDATLDVVLQTDHDPALPPVAAVPQELGRVFLNLIQNACYAVLERKKREGAGFVPTVRIRTRAVEGGAEVHFRDNGTGIPPAVREKLFTPFFTTKPAGAGTGLGLSISYDIVVRLHGGRIEVESEEGRFTEVRVRLPAPEAAQEKTGP